MMHNADAGFYLIKGLVLAMIQGYEVPIQEPQNLVDSSIVVAEQTTQQTHMNIELTSTEQLFVHAQQQSVRIQSPIIKENGSLNA